MIIDGDRDGFVDEINQVEVYLSVGWIREYGDTEEFMEGNFLGFGNGLFAGVVGQFDAVVIVTVVGLIVVGGVVFQLFAGGVGVDVIYVVEVTCGV